MPAQAVDGRTGGGGAVDGGAVDGRVLRGERNRDAIVDALLALLEEGEVRPTAREIAARAGVSPRSVFQHFDDLEGLYAAAADRQTERIAGLVDNHPDGAPLGRRVEWLAEQRALVYERIAPVRRATILAAPESPELQRRLAGAAAWAQSQVAAVFAPELAESDRGAELAAALGAAASWETWDHLRRVQGLSVGVARRVVERLLGGALAADGRAARRRAATR